MASLALAASLIVLTTLLMGPITYILARLHLPAFIIYVLSLMCVAQGLWFCSIAIPIWYIGLIPVYFAYLSIQRVRNRHLRKATANGVDNR